MAKNVSDLVNAQRTNLVQLERVTETKKKSANFTSDIDFIYVGINNCILLSAAGEKLSDEEMAILRTKANNLIADIEAILS